MIKLGDLLKELRGNKSLRAVAEITGLSHSYIADIEKGFRRDTKAPIHPSPDILKRLAAAYNYPYEDLLRIAGYIDEKPLSKEEKDIAKRLEQIRNDLVSGNSDADGLAFHGEPLSEEAIESLMEAMEHIVRQTQRINKKYIPKKYRDKDNE